MSSTERAWTFVSTGEGARTRGELAQAHTTLPTFPVDGYLSFWNRRNAPHVEQLGLPSGLNKNIYDILFCSMDICDVSVTH